MGIERKGPLIAAALEILEEALKRDTVDLSDGAC